MTIDNNGVTLQWKQSKSTCDRELIGWAWHKPTTLAKTELLCVKNAGA